MFFGGGFLFFVVGGCFLFFVGGGCFLLFVGGCCCCFLLFVGGYCCCFLFFVVDLFLFFVVSSFLWCSHEVVLSGDVGSYLRNLLDISNIKKLKSLFKSPPTFEKVIRERWIK